MTTFRPLGPSVTFTASARISMPRSMRARASSPKRTSLAAMCLFLFVRSGGFGEGGSAFDDAEQVALLHNQQLFAVELDLGARPLTEHHPVPGLHIQRDEGAGLVARAWAGSNDLTLHRLLFD